MLTITTKMSYFSQDRISQDKSVNEYGNVLLDMVNFSDMYILNCRTLGDLSGKYTFQGHRGSSTIDYFLIDRSLVRNCPESFEPTLVGSLSFSTYFIM